MQGPAELADLRRHLVLEVSGELADPREGGVGIAGQIDVTDAFFGDPRGPHFAVRVTREQQTTEAFSAVLWQAFTGDLEELAAR